MSDQLFISTRKGLFDLKRNGTGAWEIAATHFLGTPVCLAHWDATRGELFAALDDEHYGPKLHRSSDGGKSWTECATPALPASDAEDAPAVKLVWAMATGKSTRLWAGTIPAALFHSDDRGQSWQLSEALYNVKEKEEWFGGGFSDPGLHSICIDPRNEDHVVVGISCGGVWRTEDAGAKWAMTTDGLRANYMPPAKAFEGATQDPHMLAQCAANPEVIWIQHHNGIFKSENCGTKWQEVTDVNPSTFGFPVAVHPKDPKTAWFAPAIADEERYPADGKFIITRTRDGGTTFEVLDKGLPQTPAYDLVFRHALVVDETGDRLAVGSTSGGLWITENGGEEWHLSDVRFPPIAAVAFG